jgi:hypothetical protein
MVNTRRKNQAAKGSSARGGDLQGEQLSANGPSSRQQEEVRIADPAMSEQTVVTIKECMNDLKEMIQKQADEIEKMNREREAWQKQQLEFQAMLVNLGLGQQAPQ